MEIAIRIDAGYSGNGGSRRGWLIYNVSSQGTPDLIGFLDDGSGGHIRLRQAFPHAIEVASLSVPYSEYREARTREIFPGRKYAASWSENFSTYTGGFVAKPWRTARELLINEVTRNLEHWASRGNFSDEEKATYRAALLTLEDLYEPRSGVWEMKLRDHTLRIEQKV